MNKPYVISFLGDEIVFAYYFIVTNDAIEEILSDPLKYLEKGCNLTPLESLVIYVRDESPSFYRGLYYFTNEDYRKYVTVSELGGNDVLPDQVAIDDISIPRILMQFIDFEDLDPKNISDYAQLVFSRYFYSKYSECSMQVFGSQYSDDEWVKKRCEITTEVDLSKVLGSKDYSIISPTIQLLKNGIFVYET